jgi:hypothetical protein
MTDYGKRSPIGSTFFLSLLSQLLSGRLTSLARQEKILQGLMSEIVRMTTQQQPLEVGIPLYPFSHARVFSKPAPGSEEDGGHVSVAPLPLSPSFEETISPPHGSPPQSNTSPPITDGLAWISR